MPQSSGLGPVASILLPQSCYLILLLIHSPIHLLVHEGQDISKGLQIEEWQLLLLLGVLRQLPGFHEGRDTAQDQDAPHAALIAEQDVRV